MPPVPQTSLPEGQSIQRDASGKESINPEIGKLKSGGLYDERSVQQAHQKFGWNSPMPIYLNVPYSSPTPSEFGDDYHKQDCVVSDLPGNIVKYLDAHGLEAYFVPADGNCLFRALTFGPEWSKHDLARAATALYLDGLFKEKNADRKNRNDITDLMDVAQIKKIAKGNSRT